MGDRPVKISAAMMQQPFHGCTPEFIRDVCQGRCCRSPGAKTGTGTMITIHPSEVRRVERAGGVVVDGLLLPRVGERQCPFQDGDYLCGLHGTAAKPFGCIASPFTLNENDTLIVRNRYRMLPCYKTEGAPPAYKAFFDSLRLIFGQDAANDIDRELDSQAKWSRSEDFAVLMPERSYRMLKENDGIKKAVCIESGGPGTTPTPPPHTTCSQEEQMDTHMVAGESRG
jgi:hypothetical protein